MRKIKYLRTGSGTSIENANLQEEYNEAIRQGYYIGFYHELRNEDAVGQIRNFLRQVMGKRCDARPALEVSRITSPCIVQQALQLLQRLSHVSSVIYTRESLTADYGCPIWVEDGENDMQSFLLTDQERLVSVESLPGKRSKKGIDSIT